MFLLNNFVMTTEQRTNLKFLVRFEKFPSKALCMLEQVYKEQTLSLSTVSLRHKRFKEGCENLEVDPRCGRPSTSRSETNVELVKKIVRGDRRLTMRLISDELGLNRKRIWQIIAEDLGMCKVCAKMIPHLESFSTSSRSSTHFLFHREIVDETKSALCRLAEKHTESFWKFSQMD